MTFFYNGGPGSSSVFLLLGSFAPRRIKTTMPGFTPPAPYSMEDNPDSLIDRSDLVYINPVGTGYSAAIAPIKNRDFWGVDQDALSIKQFIKRYLTKNNRWNSPKFLFGESYGTARSCVLAYMLHEDGVDLNGITLQSCVLDYPATSATPSASADIRRGRLVSQETGIHPPPTDPAGFHGDGDAILAGRLRESARRLSADRPATVQTLSQYIGIPANVLIAWSSTSSRRPARAFAVPDHVAAGPGPRARRL